MSTAFSDTKPWPSQKAAPAQAGMGHNKPPLEEQVVIDFEEAMKTEGLAKRVNDIVASAGRAGECDSEEKAGKIADLIRMSGAATKAIEAEREKLNRPILNAQRALKGSADKYSGQLSDAINPVRKKLDAYMAMQRYADQLIHHINEVGSGFIGGTQYPYPVLLRELEEKVVADERCGNRKGEVEKLRLSTLAKLQEYARNAAQRAADQKAEEKEAAEPEPAVIETPPPPAPEPTIIRSDYGARVGSTTVWKHEIESVRQLPNDILNHEKVVEAINKVIAARVRSGERKIKGCRIFSDQATTVR